MGSQIFSIIGIGVIAAAIAVIMRQAKPEYALFVSLIAGVFITYKMFGDLIPVVAEIEAILSSTGMQTKYAEILFKSLGICILAQIACDTCKDAGESAIASKIEIAGRIGVLVISLPLFTQVLSVVRSLMQ